jgi:hypothetical protein
MRQKIWKGYLTSLFTGKARSSIIFKEKGVSIFYYYSFPSLEDVFPYQHIMACYEGFLSLSFVWFGAKEKAWTNITRPQESVL